MRWLVDECVAAVLVEHLRGAHHDASYVPEFASATADTDIITRASDEQRLLLTADKDFGELVWRRRWPVPGLLLLRIPSQDEALSCRRLEAAIQIFGDGLFGRYTVVEASRFRSRSLPSTTAK